MFTIEAGEVPDSLADTKAVGDRDDDQAWAKAVEDFLADAAQPENDAAHDAPGGLPASERLPAEVPALLEEQEDLLEQPVDETHHAELVAVFALEAEEHLATLSGSAVRLDVEPGDGEAMAEARRVLHTLKGASGALGLDTTSRICHRTESRLDVLEAEDPASAASLLFQVIDALEQLVRGLATIGREGAVELPEPLALRDSTTSAGDALADVSDRGPAPVPAEMISEAEEAPARNGSVRVELQRVDDLLNLTGEVVLSRSGLEQRFERIGRSAEELRLTVARLRRVAQYLEDRYEVAELTRTAPDERGDFDELEMDRYTELHRVSREVNEVSADAETTSGELELVMKELDTLISRQARLGSDIQDKLMAIRLVRLSSLAARLHRIARSVGLKQGKQVDFVLSGGQTELDKRVLEELGDVMLHLIRNAVDHGLESPKERERAGKPSTGAITVRAFREGNEAIIQISDDGRGVDLARLRHNLEAAGLIGQGQDIDQHELMDLMFWPGISTSRTATEVSGRGVGLDVVRTVMGRLKGSVSVSSEPDQGTTFMLRLPVVLAVLPAMLVKVGAQTYAIPLLALERVLRTSARPQTTLGRTPLIELEGEAFPYLELGPLLGHSAPIHRSDEPRPILVVRTGERRVALAVNEVLGQHEVVVKTLGPHLREVRGVLGATIQGDGRVLLVLNTAELITARVLRGVPTRADGPTTPSEGRLTALVVDDSLSVRKLLARTLERDGWEVREARDGVDALEVLQGYRPRIVLLDIEMPRMDGFELAGILRDVPDYGSPPIIMITSRAGDKHRKRAEELGAAGYIVKPYQEAELLQTVHSVAGVGITSGSR